MRSKIRGALFGLAYGDALGAPVEFQRVEEMPLRWPPEGSDPLGPPSLVTDDTQMMLAFGQALIDVGSERTPPTLEVALRQRFIAWLHSPDNNRAPGMTCLGACEKLERGVQWQAAASRGSKGCGANMRVAPAAFLPLPELAPIAQFQGALTHGHPTALAASDLTARAIRLLADGNPPARLLDLLDDYASSQRRTYHHSWLGSLWQRPGMVSPEAFIERGWDECSEILARVRSALRESKAVDPCRLVGDGWIAEEAIGTALLCFLWFPDSPLLALHRAVMTRGDSDSIACLAGALIGAHLGFDAWPTAWESGIEYRLELEKICTYFTY